MSNPNNIKDFIKLLDTNSQETVDVFIPSSEQTVKCKLLTVPQQKEVIKATLNGVKGNIMLTKVFNRIILDNLQTDEPVTIVDRNPILVQLRTASLGNKIFDDAGNETTLSYGKTHLPGDLNVTIEDRGITIDLKTPTLKKDNEYFSILDEHAYDNAGDVVNDLYVSEVAKFIDRIEFNGQEARPNARDSIKLVDNLPISLNDKILKFIKTIKDYDSSILTAKNKSHISLNARFFNTSE